jgi:protocatechuate 3,4-dioxygenase alpha subunit
MSDTRTITPSQTLGPYFAYGLTAEQYRYGYSQIADGKLIGTEDIKGKRILIKGRVLDGAGNPISDAMIEIWQSDHKGSYSNPTFRGFGRMGTGTTPDNSFTFETIKPGSNGAEAPHIHVIVLMRGMLTHVFTRIYFSDEKEVNELDPVLNSIVPERRKTLIAQKIPDGDGLQYHFDIFMQGENETVFFEF